MRRRSKNTEIFLISAAALIIFSSCGPALPKSTQDSVDSKRVNYIGSTAILTKIGKLQVDKNPEGKLMVKFDIVNKTFAPRRNIWVEVMAVFKDASGFVIHSTQWRSLMVSKDSDLPYSVLSPDAHAADFSISIRKR